MREKINILIHGEPKTGKTLMGVRKNPGVLVIDTEGSSRLVKGIDRRAITSFAQMDSLLGEIRSKNVKTVIIDTLDELVNNFAKEETRKRGGDYVYKNQLTQQGWGLMRDRFLTMTRAFRDAGADVMTICHSELIDRPDEGKTWSMKLPSNYAKEVYGQMDVVGFKEVLSAQDGSKVYRTHFEKTRMFDAGCRAVYDAVEDKLMRVLPPYIDDCSLVDILAAYDGFFDGEGKGYSIKCSNCAKKGVDSEASEEVEGMPLCADCAGRWRKMKQDVNELENERPAVKPEQA